MKRFKEFVHGKKGKEPILIPVAPVHGSHAHHKKHEKKHVDENFNMPATSNAVDWADHNDNTHLGKTLGEVHNKLDIPRSKFFEIPGNEHVSGYTQKSYRVNEDLLDKAHKRPLTWHTDPKQLSNSVKHLDKALGHQTLDHDLHVYHGTTKFNPGELSSKHPKRLIKSAAYMSTSIDKDKAMRFASRWPSSDIEHVEGHGKSWGEAEKPHILHIHLKPGQKGMYVGDNSHHQKEREFILPRNTVLKVHPTPTVLHNGVTVWHSHVVESRKKKVTSPSSDASASDNPSATR